MATNKPDVVSLDVPLLIRLLEYAREDAKTDMDLHDLTEQLISKSTKGGVLKMADYEALVKKPVKSSFLVRATDRSTTAVQMNAMLEELARDPTLRGLGWCVAAKPLNVKPPATALGNGEWFTNSPTIMLDKSVREKTDRALTKLGWNRSWTGQARKWSYQKTVGDECVYLCLHWSLGSKVSTDAHPAGRQSYPIKYMEIFFDCGVSA